MKLIINDGFKQKLGKSLKANKMFLKERSLQALEETLTNYYKIMLQEISFSKLPLLIDYDRAKKCIEETISLEENPQLQLRTSNSINLRENEIKFKILKSLPPLNPGTQEQIEYAFQRKKMEYEAEDVYWKDLDNKNDYSSLANFPCFVDIIGPISQVQQFHNNGLNYNVDRWVKYLFDLVQKNFPEYKFSEIKSSKRVFRFLKPISEGLYFGFEYDNSDIISQIKESYIGFPEYFNLVLITEDFKKGISRDSYIFESQETILSLGILGNPFFFNPCFALDHYAHIEILDDPDNPSNSSKLKYQRVYHDLLDGTFKMIHPQDYGEKLKKHAYFYMDILGYSSKGYLEYIEKSILDSIF